MSLKRNLLSRANAVLNIAGVHAMPKYEYDAMVTNYRGPVWAKPALPQSAIDYLTAENPRLKDLRQRYEGHPAAAHSQWDEVSLLQTLKLEDFRADNHYVYQTRWSPSAETYLLSAYYAQETDQLGLFGNLQEDGFFGAYTVPFKNGYLISRDLLDSINQMNVLARLLGFNKDYPLKVLDIGAGYGRLAHRVVEGMPNASIVCTDAVPISTFLSEFYLKFRNASRATVIPLDEISRSSDSADFDVVTNIHSFSECRLSAIEWWLTLLDGVNVQKLFIVPNALDKFLSTETDGSHVEFLPLLESHGWTLAHSEPIYSQSDIAQRYALYPNFRFHLFTRK